VTVHPRPARRRPTATSNFGVGRRESHDAGAFYARFTPPAISTDDEIRPPLGVDTIWCHDASDMDGLVGDKTVALVVTSPPYFTGKAYEEALGEGHIPGDYDAYLRMLFGVFEQCRDKLEPGGRIAVNVANLGRKPYRSLSADVIDILEQLGLLLRGEIIWQKSHAASGSCAWGTYQRPGNPVLRDLTERIVVASRGRFDRAKTPKQRLASGLPNEGSIAMDDFIDATTDVWDIPAESATRVGHPAPFPIELPRRLIELYTYRGDLILDPFMGSGSTAVAALRTERRYVGFDTDKAYVELAEARVAAEQDRLVRHAEQRIVVPAVRNESNGTREDTLRDGLKATDLARLMLVEAGFSRIEPDVSFPPLGVDLTFRARDRAGGVWLFDVCGAFSVSRPGLRRVETLWKALGRAAVIEAGRSSVTGAGPLILLTTDLPPELSPGGKALAMMCGHDRAVHDVVDLRDADAVRRLGAYACGAARP
jgi:site-specific DNA-methyltransferase (adenine-specific)